ncbi:MAG: RsmB/NOP family class I SAM-dependent RNA methyltransferase [Desulfurococcaceae archaeon]
MLKDGVLNQLRRAYGSLALKLVELLALPSKRLYVRVNTIKATREAVIGLLGKEGIIAHPDEYVPDAVYFEIEGPFALECPSSKTITVDVKTAASLLLGANLYRPGVLKAKPFKEGELLLAVTGKGVPVACIKAVHSYSEILYKQRGLVGINVCSPYKAPRIADTEAYIKGLIYPQSAPSIITTHVLKPRAGELVIDMNASPGGKTSHIVQLTRGRSRIIAIDRNEKKVEELRTTLTKLGLFVNVIVVPADSRYVHVDFNVHNADRVLIDPPCSNLGVRPLLDYTRTLKDVTSLSSYQKQFLKAASGILKPGGVLVYSTCTLTVDENEENVVYAVEELGLTPMEPEEPPPYAEKVSYKGIVAYRFSPFTEDMPGYFIAVLTK